MRRLAKEYRRRRGNEGDSHQATVVYGSRFFRTPDNIRTDEAIQSRYELPPSRDIEVDSGEEGTFADQR